MMEHMLDHQDSDKQLLKMHILHMGASGPFLKTTFLDAKKSIKNMHAYVSMFYVRTVSSTKKTTCFVACIKKKRMSYEFFYHRNLSF